MAWASYYIRIHCLCNTCASHLNLILLLHYSETKTTGHWVITLRQLWPWNLNQLISQHDRPSRSVKPLSMQMTTEGPARSPFDLPLTQHLCFAPDRLVHKVFHSLVLFPSDSNWTSIHFLLLVLSLFCSLVLQMPRISWEKDRDTFLGPLLHLSASPFKKCFPCFQCFFWWLKPLFSMFWWLKPGD